MGDVTQATLCDITHHSLFMLLKFNLVLSPDSRKKVVQAKLVTFTTLKNQNSVKKH